LFIGMYFFWEVHALDYNDQATDRQATTIPPNLLARADRVIR
jgi:hypothetical protein